jgi:hypothetical protein
MKEKRAAERKAKRSKFLPPYITPTYKPPLVQSRKTRELEKVLIEGSKKR